VYLELSKIVSKVLTQAHVAKVKANGRQKIIRDAGSRGLFLVVHVTDSKSWLMRWRRPGGGEDKITLGPVDLSGRPHDAAPQIGSPLSLVAARQLAARLNSDRAGGIDVVSQHKAAKHKRRVAIIEASSNSFLSASRDFVTEHAKVKTRTWKETARNLGLEADLKTRPRGLVSRWADRDVRSITASELHVVIEESRKFGIPGVEVRREKATESRAHKAHAALSSLFGWLQRRRRVERNPMTELPAPSLPATRDRVLSVDEIRRFWSATDKMKPPVGDVLRLLLLTGCRVNEITRLEWPEVSSDGSALTIGSERTKNRLAFVIPLSPLARDIIALQSRSGTYVFGAKSVTPIWLGSKIKGRLDLAMGDVPPWRLHDLRRTAATGMASIGVAPHVVESVLNHISGFRGGVAGTYNRHSYLNEKKEALERWETHLLALVGGSQ
jgi:integrase